MKWSKMLNLNIFLICQPCEPKEHVQFAPTSINRVIQKQLLALLTIQLSFTNSYILQIPYPDEDFRFRWVSSTSSWGKVWTGRVNEANFRARRFGVRLLVNKECYSLTPFQFNKRFNMTFQLSFYQVQKIHFSSSCILYTSVVLCQLVPVKLGETNPLVRGVYHGCWSKLHAVGHPETLMKRPYLINVTV